MSIQLRCWESNPRPLEHESSPITTKPGLPPRNFALFVHGNTRLYFNTRVIFIESLNAKMAQKSVEIIQKQVHNLQFIKIT